MMARPSGAIVLNKINPIMTRSDPGWNGLWRGLGCFPFAV
jgi:hypothetical protein